MKINFFFAFLVLVAAFVLLQRTNRDGFFGILNKVLSSLIAVSIIIMAAYIAIYFGLDIYYTLFE